MRRGEAGHRGFGKEAAAVEMKGNILRGRTAETTQTSLPVYLDTREERTRKSDRTDRSRRRRDVRRWLIEELDLHKKRVDQRTSQLHEVLHDSPGINPQSRVDAPPGDRSPRLLSDFV